MLGRLKTLVGRAAGHGLIIVPGTYAWLTTVAVPALAPSASYGARGVAGLALLALLAGATLLSTHVRLARAVGIYGFVGLSVTTWLLVGGPIGVDQIEPVRAAVGVLGWAIFAFGWGRLRDRRHVPEDDPRVIPGPPLAPRATLPVGASAVFGATLVLAIVPVLLAWRVDRPAPALLAHASALLVAIALLVGGSTIATERGRFAHRPAPAERIRAASWNLILLGALCVGGLFVGLLL